MWTPKLQPGNKGPWVGAGVAICAAFLMTVEGFEPVPVHERVDPPGVITYCFGRTTNYDAKVPMNSRFTKAECYDFLIEDLQKYAAPFRACMPDFDKMPPKRQAGVVSFGYSIGSDRACKSTAIRKLNDGDVQGGCDAMMSWIMVNGRKCDDKHCGLGNRRRAERALCLAKE